MTSKRFMCDAKVNESELWRPVVTYVVAETGCENLQAHYLRRIRGLPMLSRREVRAMSCRRHDRPDAEPSGSEGV
jgi:hypothetical protein